MDILLARLTQISEEVKELEGRVAELRKMDLRRADLRTTADHIVRFIRQFDDLFAAAPADEKKVLLRKCVSEVVIDKDRGVIQIAGRRVPAVSAELEELFSGKRKPATGVAGLANHGVERHPSKTNPATQVAGLSSRPYD